MRSYDTLNFKIIVSQGNKTDFDRPGHIVGKSKFFNELLDSFFDTNIPRPNNKVEDTPPDKITVYCKVL